MEATAIVRAARGAPVLCPEQPWVLQLTGREGSGHATAAAEQTGTAELLPWLAERSLVPRPHVTEPVTRQQSVQALTA